MNPYQKKICGISNAEDAEMVASFFPDYMGFIFYSKSPRNISVEKFHEISDSLRFLGDNCPQLIAVTVDAKISFLEKIAEFCDGFQLHGNESPEYCSKVKKMFPNKKIWKAFQPESVNDLKNISTYADVDGVLIDAFHAEKKGGTGNMVEINILKNAKNYISDHQKLIIAGGISEKNIGHIAQFSQVDIIDISSSVESKPGRKSEKKVERVMCG